MRERGVVAVSFRYVYVARCATLGEQVSRLKIQIEWRCK